MEATPGERWAADALAELRRARYRPRAWTRFAEESLDRAAATSRARPDLAAQAGRWCACGCLPSTAGTATLGSRVGAGAALAWSLAVTAMLRWHLGMLESSRGDARDGLRAADAMTLARLFAVPLVATSAERRIVFQALLAAGAGSDILDGHLARRAGATRLGGQLDATADMAFFGTATVTAARAGFVRPLAARALVGRHAVAALGTAVHYFGLARRPPDGAARVTRWTAPVLAGALLLGANGRRAAATAAICASSLAAVVQQIGALSRSGQTERPDLDSNQGPTP